MDLLQKDVPILAKIYEAKCFYDSQNNRIILYYKNHVTARTLVDVYNLPTTPPSNSSLYVIYDLQTGTFNVSTDPPTYTVSNSKVYITSPINVVYDMDKVIIYRISWYETDTDIDSNHTPTQPNTTDIDLNYILTQLDTLNNFMREQQANTNHILTRLDTFDNFVREQQANTNYILTQLDTLDNFMREQQANTNHILTQLDTLDNSVREQQANTNYILTQLDTFVRKQQADTITATHTFDPTHPGPAFQLGPNAQNQLIRYLNADKVDGFNASQTPAPNTIPVALPTGKLDIGWLPDGIGVYRRVDLTDATSDYELQVGEEAIIRFDTTQSTTKNLRVATVEGLYQMFIWARYDTSINNNRVALFPNNQSYSNAFTLIGLWLDGESTLGYGSGSISYFSLDRIIQGGLLLAYISTYTLGKFMIAWQNVVGSVGHGIFYNWIQRWNDTTTPWTKLGTISTADSVNGTLIIIVRRLA